MSAKAVDCTMDVLVVDDDPAVGRLLTRFLQDTGCQVTGAEDGVAAGALVAAKHYPVVFVDRCMPRMDGLAFCRMIRNSPQAPFMYVVMMTAFDEPGAHLESLGVGADDFVRKPLRREEVVARARVGQRLHAAHRNGLQRAIAEQERDALTKAVDAMEEALGVVAHELRAPLAGLQMMMELSAYEPTEWRAAETPLQMMKSEVRRLQQLVERLLLVTRCQAGCAVRALAECDVGQICRSAGELMDGVARNRGVTLEIRVADDLLIQGDEGALKQVVINLVNNAISHSSGGVIVLQAGRIAPEDGSYVEICISDSGTGIAPEALETLRAALATEHTVIDVARATKAGFGLAICRHIVAAHGGRLSIESRFGTGTKVRACLPEGAAR